MLCRLFMFASAASLLAFVAVMTLWVRSHFIEDRLTQSSSPVLMPGQSVGTQDGIVLTCRTGTIRMHREEWNGWIGQPATPGWDWVRVPSAWYESDFLGWPPVRRYVQSASAFQPILGGQQGRGLAVECWFPALLTIALPACWLISRQAWRRRSRTAHGLCPTCGYDVRACAERCSECGEPLPRGQAAAPAVRPPQ